jgi:hypothetical protein
LVSHNSPIVSRSILLTSSLYSLKQPLVVIYFFVVMNILIDLFIL